MYQKSSQGSASAKFFCPANFFLQTVFWERFCSQYYWYHEQLQKMSLRADLNYEFVTECNSDKLGQTSRR
jgi:hypothetical protein